MDSEPAAKMRALILRRLAEDRKDALERVEIAKNKERAEAARLGALNGSRVQLRFNEVVKSGMSEYLDQLAKFIHQIGGLSQECADLLRIAGDEFKGAYLAKLDHEMAITRALGGHSDRVAFRSQLIQDLDRIIARKVEDFELGIIGGTKMEDSKTVVTNNSVNIINSTISDTVLTIAQSGKDSQLKDVAQKIGDLMQSAEIINLPEDVRLEILDHAENVVSEINKPAPDSSKVLRGLKRLGSFLTTAGVEFGAKVVAELSLAWAKNQGMV